MFSGSSLHILSSFQHLWIDPARSALNHGTLLLQETDLILRGAWASKTDLSDLSYVDTRLSIVVFVILMNLSSLITSAEKSSGLMDLYFLKACFLESET